MPGKEVQIIKTPGDVRNIKSIIGKKLCRIDLNENTIIIADKNANVEEFNRFLGDEIIYGAFLVVSYKNNKVISMKKRDLRRFRNRFRLKKHQKKIEHYKEEYLEEYYYNQRIMKMKNAKINSEELMMKIA